MNTPVLSLVFAILLCGHAVWGVSYTYHRPSTKRVTTPKPVVIDAMKQEMREMARFAVREITRIEKIHTELVEIVQSKHHYDHGLVASLELRVRMDNKPFVCKVKAILDPWADIRTMESFDCKPDHST